MGDSDALSRLADLDSKIEAVRAEQAEMKVTLAAARSRRDEVLEALKNEFGVTDEASYREKVSGIERALQEALDEVEEALRRSVG